MNQEFISTEVISQAEAQELGRLLGRFIQAYGAKPEGQSDEEWLQNRLMLEGLSAESAADQSRETTEAIRTYDKNLASLLSAIEDGQTESEWFADRAQEAGLSDAQLAARLVGVCESLEPFVEKPDAITQGGDWTSDELRLLAKFTGDRLMLAGVQSAIEFAEYEPKDFDGEPAEGNGAVARALETGRDAGLKAAAAGALSVAVQKKIINVTVVEAPVYANLACVSVENVKTAMQVADNKFTESEGVDRMAANTAVAVTDMVFEASGRAAGAAALSWIPVIGPIIGGKLGAICGKKVAKEAGPIVYEKVEKAKSPLAVRAKQMFKQAGTTAKNAANTLKGFAKKIFG